MSHISRVMPTRFSSSHKNFPDRPTSSRSSRFSSNPGDCAQTNISLPSTVPLIFLIPDTSFRGQYAHPSLEDAVSASGQYFGVATGTEYVMNTTLRAPWGPENDAHHRGVCCLYTGAVPQFQPLPLGRRPRPFSHPDWL